MPKTKHLVQDIVEWLESNAHHIYQSLNAGTSKCPSFWPEKLRAYYRFYNGQKCDSDFLFPTEGYWLSVEDSEAAREVWLDYSEQHDFDWYKESYFPIVAYLDQMESAIVVDTETGQIGEVSLELQEFTFLFKEVDELFSHLLHTLKSEGYPAPVKYKTYTEEELDQMDRKSALDVELENFQTDNNPSSQQLFDWAINIFRQKGDPKYSKPNLHFMRLAKKYFDQIPAAHLSSKQVRELAIFQHRHQQIENSPRNLHITR